MSDADFKVLENRLYKDLGHGSHVAGDALTEHAEQLRQFLARLLQDTPLSGELRHEAERLLGRRA